VEDGMLTFFLISAMAAPASQRIERPIMADPVPLSVATKGLVEDAPRLEYDVRELLMCDPDAEARPQLCYAVANLDRWQRGEEREEQRKEDELMEEAIDQAREGDPNIPWH
jgi:hypothetical protein